MKKTYLFLTFASLLLLSNLAHADGDNSTIIDFSGIISAINNLPGAIVNDFFSYTVSGLTSASEQLVDSSFKFMFSSPDPGWFCNSYNDVMAIVETLYSLVLMALALYFILRSNDAEGRANAKKWLENMLIMMVVLAFSFQIFQILIDLNSSLASSFANDSMKSIFESPLSFSSTVFALVVLVPSIAGISLTLITLLLRYLLIPFLLFLFPIAIFLYFIPITQKWGRAFFSIIVAVVFMTAFDALLLLALSSLFNSSDPTLADPLIHAFAVLFGFAALGIINLLIFVLAILSVVLQNNTVRSVVGFAVAGKVLTR
ncbi:MAG: hypothetical protein QW568_03445 [Candidatus Anstonellaceae archaeon]